ncbi:hypothetical protein Cgig2_025294 [Carnegiea gigantea]|uniref:Uncharacterized protein n=1 Tax=Carnegiea gigantea TaxID=171969 RepID=A0A9Q1KBV5_9CARY|nr:hypothetical protein Cgig2_025294 [Carnegiea gigantea]
MMLVLHIINKPTAVECFCITIRMLQDEHTEEVLTGGVAADSAKSTKKLRLKAVETCMWRSKTENCLGFPYFKDSRSCKVQSGNMEVHEKTTLTYWIIPLRESLLLLIGGERLQLKLRLGHPESSMTICNRSHQFDSRSCKVQSGNMEVHEKTTLTYW